MFEFTEDERIYLTHMHSLAVDEQGRQILIGLSWGDTAYLMEHRRNFSMGIREHDPDRRNKAMVLENNHKLARLRALGESVEKGQP